MRYPLLVLAALACLAGCSAATRGPAAPRPPTAEGIARARTTPSPTRCPLTWAEGYYFNPNVPGCVLVGSNPPLRRFRSGPADGPPRVRR